MAAAHRVDVTGVHGHDDEAPRAAGDGARFERLVARHADELLAFAFRRTREAQLAADVTAETFAAAAIAGGARSPEDRPAGAWLQAIALEQIASARRRGSVEQSARRRLGMERIELSAADAAAIEALGGAPTLWTGRGGPAPATATAFTTRLGAQLGDATARPARRGGRRGAAVAVLAGALVLAVLAAVVPSRTEPGTARAGPGPRVVANVAPAEGLGRTAQVAFGSVWLSATNDEAVLRVDPRTRRVVARIPVGTDVNIGAGAGAVWAVPRRPTVARARLVRIDPRTNRVVARIPIPSPGARYPLGGAAVVAGSRVWVVGALGLVAVDPRRNRPVRQVVLGGGYLVVGSLLRDGEVWVNRADGSVTRFDALTGRRLGRQPWIASSGLMVPADDRVVTVTGRSVSLVDRRSGRTLWRTEVGRQLNDAEVVAGRVLVEGSDGTRSRDTLWELDRRTGRVVGSLTVPGFSITTLLRVGREGWLVTADGHVIAVSP